MFGELQTVETNACDEGRKRGDEHCNLLVENLASQWVRAQLRLKFRLVT